MTARLLISSHRYTKVVTTEMISQCADFRPTDHRETVAETVVALFEIHGGDCIRRVPPLQPKTLEVTFRSDGGGRWEIKMPLFDVILTGSNVKRDGSLSVEKKLRSPDFPAWVDKLYEGDGDDRSDALDWVRATYPR